MKKEMELLKEEVNRQLDILEPSRGLANVGAFKEKAQWALDNMKPKFHIAYGNYKLPKTTAIVNLGSWFNCPGRVEGFCEICERCYDKSKEVMFKKISKARYEQEVFMRSHNAEEIADKIISSIKYQIFNGNNVKQIRFCEVGELRNQDDLEKIRDVSDIIYIKLNIKSYIYTHNKYLNFNIDHPNLTINGSGFMVDNEYRVLEKNETCNEDHYDCLCDCKNGCNICANKHGIIITEEVR